MITIDNLIIKVQIFFPCYKWSDKDKIYIYIKGPSIAAPQTADTRKVSKTLRLVEFRLRLDIPLLD